MDLPYGMQPSTLEERKKFYSDFNLRKARDWVGRKLVYAVVIGRHSNIYPAEYKSDRNEPLIIDKYRNLNDVMHWINKFLPEGIYYDRNYYKDFSLCHSFNLRKYWGWSNFIGQELAFDFDPENVDCPIHGSLEKRMKKGSGLSFCEKAFEITRENVLKMYDILCENYSDVRIVFSGRGFHIHVFDRDTIKFSREKRKRIAEKYKGFGIDSFVTSGEMRLIRLPFSLNGVSSRVVTPLKKSEVYGFDPSVDALPRYF
ncbi:MAG: DNA primase small subunit domain-containing protein [Candidatus Thermoplasmatota archaeon]|nr:DNA primase small subunit domain-containing protein [Candidatus Thermoplasmatota archaeon]